MKKSYQLALITGGSSGIGLALAKELAQTGTNLCILARDPEKCENTKEQISKFTTRTANGWRPFPVTSLITNN